MNRFCSMRSYVLLRISALGLLVAIILTGCGSGGSDNNSKSSSNWDQMVWDQDNWN